jgi:hypothetical protein
MNKNNPFLAVFKQVLTQEEVAELTGQEKDYTDTATKFTVYTMLHYLAQASYLKWDGFRECARLAPTHDLVPVHYSTLSKKAGEVPYEIFKRVFRLLVKKCNRETRRHLNLPKDLLLIDSTTITASNHQLSFAKYKKHRGGLKMHTAFSYAQQSPLQVEETIARRHDAPLGEVLANPDYIIVQDRAYGKIGRLDHYVSIGQSFVIRLKDNLHLVEPEIHTCQLQGDPKIVRDIICNIGQGKCRSAERQRVVEFKNDRNQVVRVVTDLREESPEVIAEIYKARWQIEVFFRWIKQHLNVPKLFGKTKNSVYNQLFAAFMVYVLLKWLFDVMKDKVPCFVKLTFLEFMQFLQNQNLPVEWQVQFDLLRRNTGDFCELINPVYG